VSNPTDAADELETKYVEDAKAHLYNVAGLLFRPVDT
jgi:hypothetical protein